MNSDRQLGWIALGVTLFYTIFIGFFALPCGFEATLVLGVALVWLLRELHRQGVRLPLYLKASVLMALVVVAYFSLTTNFVVLSLGSSAVTLVLVLLLLHRAAGAVVPCRLLAVLSTFWKLVESFAANFFLFARTKLKFGKNQVSLIVTTLLLTILPVSAIHLLLSEVNDNYAHFMQRILEIIFDEDFWRLLGEWLFQAHVLYSLISARIQVVPATEEQRWLQWLYMLVPCVVVVFIFSVFQSEYLFLPLSDFGFKQLSLYVQKGFWELVWVALIGFVLWTIVYHKALDGKHLKRRSLLGVFAVELALIAVFSMHKVVALQGYFGLKDTRALATLASILALTTFVMCLLHLVRRVRLERIGELAVVVLLTFAAGVNVVNLDLFATRNHPIRYKAEGEYHRDYSYLLTNSYDNYSAWGDLLLSYLEEPPPNPDNYYWGYYHHLCEITQYGNGHRNKVNYFKLHHRRLVNRWSRKSSGLRSRLRVNWRANEAIGWLAANSTLIEDAEQVVEELCATVPPRTYPGRY